MGDTEELEIAVIEWVNTFEVEPACTSLQDLCDGSMLASVCTQIAPDHFDPATLGMSPAAGNYVLAGSNMKHLIRSLDDFYKSVLGKCIDMSSIDVNAIVRNNDLGEIVPVVEVVVGAAVMCENKAVFIQRIFALDHDSQSVLKGIIEQVMSRVVDYEGEGDEDGDADVSRPEEERDSEDLLRSQELVRHLQDERQGLLASIADLEQNNSALSSELESVRKTLTSVAAEATTADSKKASTGGDSGAVSANSAALQAGLEEAKRELDLQVSCTSMHRCRS
jgi:hypothetical protein